MRRTVIAIVLSIMLAAALAFAACSSRSSSIATSSPEIARYDLHLSIRYESNFIFAKYNVEVMIDDEVVGTVSQGKTLDKDVALEIGHHVLAFREKGSSKSYAETNISIEGESYYKCSIKAHVSSIDINNELFERASDREARVAEEAAAKEKEEAEKAAKEEAEKKKQEEREAKRAKALEAIMACEGKSVSEAMDVARSNSLSVAYKDPYGNDVTQDLNDSLYAAAAENALVVHVENTDDSWGPSIIMHLDRGITITADNYPEFNDVLNVAEPGDPIVGAFAQKYYGKRIEFDCCIAYLAHYDNYKTRYDFLIYGGDYNPDSARGPSFLIRNETPTSFKWEGVVPDSMGMGMNVHLIATVEEYEGLGELFLIEPVRFSLR